MSDICIIPKKFVKDFDCGIVSAFDFGTALEKVYPLLQIIFENLTFEDLKSASLVNNVWAKYGNEEFQRRNKASWVSLIKSTDPELAVEKSSNFKYDSISFGLIFYNYAKIKLNKFICVHTDPVRKMTLSEYFVHEILPQHIDFWAFSCKNIYSPKLDKDTTCYFTSAFIPEIPNVNIRTFIHTVDSIESFSADDLLKDEHIHCLLLFTLLPENLLLKRFTKEIYNKQDVDTIAVGGGVISGGIKPFKKDGTRKIYRGNTLFSLAITQAKNKPAEFDAYSVVLPDDVNFEKELLEFKKKITLREHSVGIRFCCEAKDGKETEPTIFNKIFPKIFVIGLDADGEIGNNKFYSWPFEGIPEVKKKKGYPNLCHQFTTIVVILTWGKKITE